MRDAPILRDGLEAEQHGEGAPAAESPDSEEAEIGAFLRESPMLREPRRLPGSPPAHFTPEQFFLLSRVPRTDVGLDDEGLWLTEQEAPKISGHGVEFGAQCFWSPELAPFIQVKGERRKFVIRYDRALLARGVLDEIQLLEVMPDDTRVPRCRLGLKSEVIRQIDTGAVLHEVDRYRRQLQARTTEAHHALISTEHGRLALEEHLRQQRARARRQSRATREPIAAAPITSKAEQAMSVDSVKASSLAGHIGAPRTMEEEEQVPAGTHDPNEEVRSDGEDVIPVSRDTRRRPRTRGIAGSSESPPPSAKGPSESASRATPVNPLPGPEAVAGPDTPSTSGNLADHLGGALGFSTPDED